MRCVHLQEDGIAHPPPGTTGVNHQQGSRIDGLVQVARIQGNTFLDVRPCYSGRNSSQSKAFRPIGRGLYAAKCYPGLNQAELMAGGSTEALVSKHLHTLYNVGAIGNLTDGQLLERFTSGGDGSAEATFTALVERHGPMVLRVCHQVLGDAHDAQDAFQATFLVLVRRAGSVRQHDSVASWLYGVAHRVARRAKADAARRRAHERRVAVPEPIGDGDRPEPQ